MNKEVFFKRCPPEKAFWFCNGFIAHDINEMIDSLEKIDTASFRYHVNDNKNDIAKWVEEVIGDKPLARQLYRVKTKKTTIKKIMQRMSEL